MTPHSSHNVLYTFQIQSRNSTSITLYWLLFGLEQNPVFSSWQVPGWSGSCSRVWVHLASLVCLSPAPKVLLQFCRCAMHSLPLPLFTLSPRLHFFWWSPTHLSSFCFKDSFPEIPPPSKHIWVLLWPSAPRAPCISSRLIARILYFTHIFVYILHCFIKSLFSSFTVVSQGTVQYL